jgi:chromate transporter
MAKGAVTGWTTGGIALAVLLTMLWRKVNPAFLVLGGAIVGGIVFMPK